jgi:hypothetical protein
LFSGIIYKSVLSTACTVNEYDLAEKPDSNTMRKMSELAKRLGIVGSFLSTKNPAVGYITTVQRSTAPMELAWG